MTIIPEKPKIYHILHWDKLQNIVRDGCLFCDAEIRKQTPRGTTVGMDEIKSRRFNLNISSHNDLKVAECVPFYFCPRSVMLYLFHMNNHPNLNYHGGQAPIIHLESDLLNTVNWAEQNGHRWAFTLSNAGSFYFEDRNDLSKLNELNWDVIKSNSWSGKQESKQAEFLVEKSFPWHLIDRIGVHSLEIYRKVIVALGDVKHRPLLEVKNEWYY